MTNEYTPFRIMKSFVVPGPNQAYLRANFPSGSIKQVGKNRQWQSIYKFKAVVNSPTPAEIRFFEASGFARLIPQDPGGFDVRDSGIARSIKSSVSARHDHKITMARRRFAAEEAAIKAKNAEHGYSTNGLTSEIATEPMPDTKLLHLPNIETDTEGIVREEHEAVTEITPEPEEVTAPEPETEPKKTSRGRRKRKKSDEES